jgi:periplasmic divalent cation tolerance protein
MTDKIVVFSTCATEEEADKLARVLVEARVAACVTIVPGVRSVYRWQAAIESALEQAHAYDVPEVLALPVVEGAPNYMHWLEGELGA